MVAATALSKEAIWWQRRFPLYFDFPEWWRKNQAEFVRRRRGKSPPAKVDSVRWLDTLLGKAVVEAFAKSMGTDFEIPARRPDSPTVEQPGTPGKIEVLSRRVELRQSLHHPADRDDLEGWRLEAFNNQFRHKKLVRVEEVDEESDALESLLLESSCQMRLDWLREHCRPALAKMAGMKLFKKVDVAAKLVPVLSNYG